MGAMSDLLDVPVMVGVGAAFDYLAGTKTAAPVFLRHAGFEWVFRLAVEPKRLWRRYLIGNTRFVWLVTWDALSGQRSRPRGR
jgi:N-acetylglucosaminyldiphosphoundecaprenol N-acetyl-beta-D-mannosaminyltransferase